MPRSTRPLAIALVALLAAAAPTLAAYRIPRAQQPLTEAVNLGSPAAQLRVDLDRLLAEHAFLTIEQMRAGLLNSSAFSAAATAVEGNSAEVAAAIGSIYGDAAAEPFGDIWRSHIGYLVDYSVALRTADTSAQQAALSGLATYRANLARFLTAANPGIPLGRIADALDMHTAQLLKFIDTEHTGDHAGAYAIEREAYAHMFEVGDALAKLIANKFSARFKGLVVAYSVAGTLRVTLDRLLAEHAFLAADAMRAGIAGSGDLDAAKDAIAGNSTDLQAVVAAAYGRPSGAAFRTLWDGHIAGYLAYIEATRANDATARVEAGNNLGVFAGQIAGFLAGANPHLDAAALSALFQQHAQHLTGQVEAFAAGDFDGTYELVRMGYRHMFMAGEALATGIAAQFPKKFPANAGLPDTATVGPSDSGPARQPLVVLGLLLGLGIVLVAAARGAARGSRLGR